MMVPGARAAVFVALLVGFLVLERAVPARSWRSPAAERWFAHGALGAFAALVAGAVAFIAPVMVATGAAGWAGAAGFGLLNWLAVPPLLAGAVSIIVLDCAIYFQHRLMHVLPVLWRFHAVHHHDHDLDVTTALRFHPGEILLSTLYKAGVAALLGAPVASIALYELILSSMALANHANVALPPRVERWVRLVLVTPTMHVRHHSTVRAEHDRNFGNLLSFWDRLFGTWHREPPVVRKFPLGLGQTQGRRVDDIGWLLALPWRGR
jgi:sterol desaturase/sphingolipid hydroxylase (fatty acid hydroxylase superfamily)